MHSPWQVSLAHFSHLTLQIQDGRLGPSLGEPLLGNSLPALLCCKWKMASPHRPRVCVCVCEGERKREREGRRRRRRSRNVVMLRLIWEKASDITHSYTHIHTIHTHTHRAQMSRLDPDVLAILHGQIVKCRRSPSLALFLKIRSIYLSIYLCLSVCVSLVWVWLVKTWISDAFLSFPLFFSHISFTPLSVKQTPQLCCRPASIFFVNS